MNIQNKTLGELMREFDQYMYTNYYKDIDEDCDAVCLFRAMYVIDYYTKEFTPRREDFKDLYMHYFNNWLTNEIDV